MSIRNSPESLSQRILVGIILVGRLGVNPRETDPVPAARRARRDGGIEGALGAEGGRLSTLRPTVVWEKVERERERERAE